MDKFADCKMKFLLLALFTLISKKPVSTKTFVGADFVTEHQGSV